MKSSGTKGTYQKCKPITDRNIGKAHHHEKRGTHRHIDDTQSGSSARRHNQMEKRAEFGSRRERQECKRLGITLAQLRAVENVS